MEKKILLLRKKGARQMMALLAVLLAVSVCIAAPNAYANEAEENGETGESTESVQETGSSVVDLRNDLKKARDDLDAARGEYDDAVKELKALESQIAILEALISDTEAEIEALQAEINENSEKLFELSQHIVALDQEIYDQNSSLNKRLRIMYMTDDQSMLAVVLGSENFVDLMSNLEMVRKIHECDTAFLADLEIKLDELEIGKAEVEKIDAKLKDQRGELQAYKDQLDEDKAALAAARKRVQEIRDAAAAEVDRLEKESKRIEQELVNMTSQWGDYAGGAMAWPVLGRVTSEFGMRYHPITGRYTMHTGIDIGCPTGTPIHAAADGIVCSSGWNNGGYGYLVMIDNGSGIVTMYAHNSALAVSAGAVVYRGDIIAYAGSTGNSTGPHCHFEVRVNGSPQNPRGWLG